MSTRREALRFVERHGVVLESGAGPVPSLSEAITGELVNGGWRSHRDAKIIFALTRAVRASDDVLVCKAINSKVTYVHRRLWPAVVCLADRLGPGRFNRVIDERAHSGSHGLRRVLYPHWVPRETLLDAKRLDAGEAERLLAGRLGALRA